jgi:hypothetical protein
MPEGIVGPVLVEEVGVDDELGVNPFMVTVATSDINPV